MKKSDIKSIIRELNEASNPDLEKKIVNLVSRCSKEYGISIWEAYNSIRSKMEQMEDHFGEGKYGE
tara:strand:+ start:348 stop:545 length:198 start_codon:yes stop_codon:yes gene_type:complete